MTARALDAPDHQDITRLHCEECGEETDHMCVDECVGSYREYWEQCKQCETIRTRDRYVTAAQDSQDYKDTP